MNKGKVALLLFLLLLLANYSAYPQDPGGWFGVRMRNLADVDKTVDLFDEDIYVYDSVLDLFIPQNQSIIADDLYLNLVNETTDVTGGTFNITTSGTVDATAYNISDKLVTVTTFTRAGIQAALDALDTEGGEVYLPEGNYALDGTDITIPQDNITIRGAGAGTILKVDDGIDAADLKIIDISSKNDCVLTNFAIDGNKDNNTGQQRGIYIDSGSGHKLTNLWIINIAGTNAGAGGDGIYVDGTPTGCLIQGCSVKNVGDDGMDINAMNESQIVGNNIDTCGDNGIDTEGSDHLTIVGNHIDDCTGHGIELEQEGAGQILYCTVSGNSIEDTTKNAIHIQSGAYCSVTGNAIHNDTAGTSKGIYIGMQVSGVGEYNVITGNMIKGMATGIEEEATDAESDYNYIAHNGVFGCTTPYVINGTNTKAIFEGSSNEITFRTNIIGEGLTASKPVFTDASKVLVSTGTLAIDQGGTNATATDEAFDNLSPLTTKGDIIVYNDDSGDAVRLPIGNDSDVLTANSSIANIGIEWAAAGAPAAHNLDSASHGDVNSVTEAKGMMWVWNTTGGYWDAFPVGTDTHVIVADSSTTLGIKWAVGGGNGGAGDVVGPAGATDHAICRYDTATGKLIQDSEVVIDDDGNLCLLDGDKLMLEGVAGDTYIRFNTATSAIEFYVNGTLRSTID